MSPNQKVNQLRSTHMKPVLVVDDEPQMRSLVKVLLADDGLDTIEAGDGCSAFATARKLDGEISLVVTDINMPCGLDGLDLAAAVKCTFPGVPVLVVSSRPSPAADRNSIDPGYEFLKKPFDVRTFVQTVRKLLTQGKSQVAEQSGKEEREGIR